MVESIGRFCNLSHKKSLYAHCDTCKVYVCKECLMKDHGFHNFQQIRSICEKALIEYKDMSNSAEIKQVLMKQASASDDEFTVMVESKIACAYEKLITKINSHCKERIEKLKESKLVKVFLDHRDKLHKGSDQMDKISRKAKNIALMLENSLKQNNYLAVLENMNKESIAHIRSQIDEIYSHNSTSYASIKSVQNDFPKIHYNFMDDYLNDMIRIDDENSESPTLTMHEKILFCAEENSKEIIKYIIPKQEAKKYRINNTMNIPPFSNSIEYQGRLFISGGKYEDFLKITYEFIEYEVILEKRADMLIKKAYHSLIAIKNEIFSIGGANQKYLNACEKYIPLECKWEMGPSLKEAKCSSSVCAFNEKTIYCFGGFNGNLVSTIEKLNVLDKAGWAEVVLNNKEGWVAVNQCASSQISNEFIVIFGGLTNLGSTANCFVFDPTNQNIMKLEENLNSCERFSMGVPKRINDSVYMIGYDEKHLHIFTSNNAKWEMVRQKMWMKNKHFVQ